MGNFEKLSVLVIVVIIVMILVVALYTWSDNPGEEPPANRAVDANHNVGPDPDPGERSGLSGADAINDWEIMGPKGSDAAGAGGAMGTDAGEPPVNAGGEFEEPPLPDPSTDDVTPKPDPKEDAPAPAEENWVYVVKPGDTLTEISERELETWRRFKEILKLNPGVTAETLREGQTLKMPPRKRATSSVKVTGDMEANGSTSSTRTSSTRGGSIPTGEYYVIRRGDTLENIAKRAYGSFDRWPELWARNLSVLEDVDDLPVGTKIFIPK